MKALPTDYRERVRKAFLSSFPEAEQEKALGFIEATGLCPFRGQVKFLSRDQKVRKGNVDTWEKAVTIVTGLDGCRAKAHATGRYLPDDQVPVVDYASPGDFHPARATVRVRVFDKHTNTWTYAVSSCRWDEYAERKTEKKKLAGDQYEQKYPVGDGTKREHYQSTWAKLSETMLVKCAEVAVLRKAFPDELGGIYIDEEMPQDLPTAPVAGDDPFKSPSRYDCADCQVEITAAQASRTIRSAADRHLCEKCEGKLQGKPAVAETPKPAAAAQASPPPPAKEEVQARAPDRVPHDEAPGRGSGDPVLPGQPPPAEVKPPPQEAPASAAGLGAQLVALVESWKMLPKRMAFWLQVEKQYGTKDVTKLTDDQLQKAWEIAQEWGKPAGSGREGDRGGKQR